MKFLFSKLYQNKTVSTLILLLTSSLLVFSLVLSSIFIINGVSNVKTTSADKDAVSSQPTSEVDVPPESSTVSETEEVKKNPPPEAEEPEKEPLPEKVCYLTFDDGPSDRTLEILDILDKYGVKATFFVVGTSNLSYVSEIHKRGNTVGLHSDTHVYSQIYSSDQAFYDDLNAVGAKVEEKIGVRPKIIRFPGGSDNLVSAKTCPGLMTRLTQSVAENGYTYVDWNIVANDTTASLMQSINGHTMTPANVIRDSVINASYTSDGADKNQICVLMHDAGNKYSTVEALPAIIENLLSRGYAILPLEEDSPIFHAQKLNN